MNLGDLIPFSKLAAFLEEIAPAMARGGGSARPMPIEGGIPIRRVPGIPAISGGRLGGMQRPEVYTRLNREANLSEFGKETLPPLTAIERAMDRIRSMYPELEGQ